MRSVLFLIAPLVFIACCNAQSWRRTQPTSSPLKRDGHAMTWDAQRGVTVVFGGYDYRQSRHYGDHWEFDGSVWSQRSLSSGPSARTRAGMCYDQRRGVLVLFGGQYGDGLFSSPTYFGDTWEFDGTSWHQVFPAGDTPSARITELAYDSARGVVVLVGGYGDEAPFRHNDTWEYDGVAWTQRISSNTPPLRPDYAIAYDRKRERIVAHPGYVWGQPVPLVTWEWDGTDWAASTASGPPPFPRPAMTYDARRERIVLVGSTYLAPQETWEYDGSSWTRSAATALSNVGIAGHALAFDQRRSTVVMFGGEVVRGGYVLSSNETWEYGEAASYASFGSACASSGPAPLLSPRVGSTPRVGGVLSVEVSNLASGAQPFMFLGANRASLSLGVLGLPTCELLVMPDLVFPLVNGGGVARWSVQIPAEPRLHGAKVHNQGFVVDPAAQPVGVTNGGTATIGS